MRSMTKNVIPIDKLMFGNEHWHSAYAADEIEVYCDLLDHLQGRIEALTTRGKDEELTLANAQMFIGSYALEIALKSLWALDHPDDQVPHTHNLVRLFGGLKEETVKALERLQLTRRVLEKMPEPFTSNRYSMEGFKGWVIVYQASFLRGCAQLLRDKLEENSEELLKSSAMFRL